MGPRLRDLEGRLKAISGAPLRLRRGNRETAQTEAEETTRVPWGDTLRLRRLREPRPPQ